MAPLGLNEIIVILFILIPLFLLPCIFFLLTQQNTLKQIQLQNRTISPGEVWLQLIPLFGLVWQFIVVNRISDSIQRELGSTNFSFENNADPYGNGSIPEARPTHSIGITYCILMCCSIVPILGVIAGLAGFICWIIYWVKLSEYKNKLQQKHYTVLSSPPSLP